MQGKEVGLILSGGNIDLSVYADILAGGQDSEAGER
jgi:threonine dehydratase